MKKNAWKIFTIAFVLLFLGGSLLLLQMTKVTKIEIIGAERHSADELRSAIFPEKDRSFLQLFIRKIFHSGRKLPYIDHVEWSFEDMHSIKAYVYEKEIVACVPYLNSYIYVDDEGTVQDSRSERIEGIPIIEGLEVQNLTMYEPLHVYRVEEDRSKEEEKDLLKTLLGICSILHKDDVNVDSVRFTENGSVYLVKDKIRIVTGNLQYIEGKIITLKEILPKLKGQKGTLYLDNYTENSEKREFLFRKEEEKETTAPAAETKAP